MSDELSRVEDLLENGVEEPVEPMSEVEAILRGEKVKPHSRVSDLLLKYNPSDKLIKKTATTNGTYIARNDDADGYYEFVVDTPVAPQPTYDQLDETVTENGEYSYTPQHDAFDSVDFTVAVPGPVLGTKTVTENGTYKAEDDNVDGYSQFMANVAPNVGTKTISANGTYNASSDELDGYSQVNISVPGNKKKSVSGLPQPIASFNDGADAVMQSLKVDIDPVQDLHGYDSPWAGGAGKNKFDIDAEHTSETGTYTYNYVINVKPNTNYTMSTNAPQTSPASLYLNGGNTGVNGVWDGLPRTFTSDENGKLTAFVRFSDIQGGIDLYTAVKNGQYYIQLEEGSTATLYAPYSNICPISGWTEEVIGVRGVNQWDEEWVVGTISSITGEYSASGDRVCSKNYIRVEPNKTYYKQNFAWQFYYDENKSFINAVSLVDGTFTIPNNACYMKFYTASTYGQTYNNDISINYPSTDTSYHAYNGQTYTIDLDGTRYGGTLDVTSGELVVDRVMVDLGTLNYTYEFEQFRATLADAKLAADRATIPNAICSIYTVTNYGNFNDMQFTLFWASAKGINIKDSRFTDATAFKTAMNGVKLVYELATPTTFYTQPTAVKSLDGENNIFADTGDVTECEYFSNDASAMVPLTVTENGVYTAPAGTAGYSPINVQVPSGGVEFPVYDFHENTDGTIVVRRKIDYVNNEFSIETLWFFNGYQFTEWQADIPSNLLEFMTDNVDVSSKSYSDNTSATQNGWIAISRAYYNDKLSCYTTDWYQNPNTEVWGVINIANGNSQTLKWSDPYDIGNGTIIDVGFKFIPSIYANTDGFGSATIDFNDPDMLKAPINHFFLNLYACYFTGSSQYTSNTTLSKTNDGHVQYAWTAQSGNTRQYFNIAYVKDLSAVKVISDWDTYNSPNPITIDVSDIDNFDVNNVIIDFKNVVSGGGYGVPDNTKVVKSYSNNTLSIILPLDEYESKSIDIRVLYINSVFSSRPAPEILLNKQISSISNKYMGPINLDNPMSVDKYYSFSFYHSDESEGASNNTIVHITSLPATASLTGLSAFRLNLTTTTLEVDNYDGSAKDVYMTITEMPTMSIIEKPD